MTFQFGDQFEVDKEESKDQLESNHLKLVTIGDMARKCLNQGDFQRYRQIFDEELANILNAMVIYTANFGKTGQENLDIYAVNMIRYVQRITDLRKLLTYVERDARKGIKQEGEEDGKV